MLVERGIATQCGWHENASGSIDLDIIGMADQQSLQAANLFVE